MSTIFSFSIFSVIMSNFVAKNHAFIRLLAETPNKQQRQALLETATRDQLRALSDICLNICLGRFNKEIDAIGKQKKKKFIKNILPIQKVATKSVSLKEKRKALSQAHKTQKGGGLFSVLLPLALTALPALLKK